MKFRPIRYPADFRLKIAYGGSVARGRVVNVSENGAVVETDLPIKPGEALSFQVGRNHVEATAKWTKQKRIGVAFVGSVSPDIFDQLRYAARRTGNFQQRRPTFRELS